MKSINSQIRIEGKGARQKIPLSEKQLSELFDVTYPSDKSEKNNFKMENLDGLDVYIYTEASYKKIRRLESEIIDLKNQRVLDDEVVDPTEDIQKLEETIEKLKAVNDKATSEYKEKLMVLSNENNDLLLQLSAKEDANTESELLKEQLQNLKETYDLFINDKNETLAKLEDAHKQRIKDKEEIIEDLKKKNADLGKQKYILTKAISNYNQSNFIIRMFKKISMPVDVDDKKAIDTYAVKDDDSAE